MRLLIVTQAVDSEHHNLGFFHGWIALFAQEYDSVEVICLGKGIHNLPQNVHVHSLGKERASASRALYALRFLSLAWRLRHSYDRVFVHMNPEYIVLAGLLWKSLGKKVALWYTHKSVTLSLRIAVMFSDMVFSASAKSFRLSTDKLHIAGHGIDTAHFVRQQPTAALPFSIITFGRISESKHVFEMIEATYLLRQRDVPATLTIVGAPATDEDVAYVHALKERIHQNGWGEWVDMVGPLPHAQLPALLQKHALFLNLSTTGSMDKAVLEAMAAGVVPVTSNEAFKELLTPFGLYVSNPTPSVVADCLEYAATVSPEPFAILVSEQFSVQSLIHLLAKTLRTK